MHRDETLFDPNLSADTLEKRRAAEPLARRDFAIIFSARTGSSWLTDVCEATRFLSRPDECFNPAFMPEMTRVLGARKMEEYVEVLRRRRNTGGLFGFEATPGQLCAVFGNLDAFWQHFSGAHYFWLMRRDIVAQAISLAKMVTTGVGHSVGADSAALAAQDSRFPYDASLIRQWLNHILDDERRAEAFFRRYDVTPTAFSYEGMMARGAVEMANFIAADLGLADRAGPEVTSRHERLATATSRDYAERFRRDAARFLRGVEAERAAWLATCRF